jgi:hypothetical protein
MEMLLLTKRIRFPRVSEWAAFTRGFPFIGLDAKIKRRVKTILKKRNICDVAKAWEALSLSPSEMKIKQSLLSLLEIHFSIKSMYILPEDDMIVLAWDETGDLGDVEFYSEIEHHFLLDELDFGNLSLIAGRGARLIDLIRFLERAS